MDEQWYYRREGHTFGPVSGQHLKQLVDAGQLTGDDLIWREGMHEWLPARRVGLVRGKAAAVPPPTPSTPPPNAPSASAPSRPRGRRRGVPTGVWVALVVFLMVASAASAWMAQTLLTRHTDLAAQRPAAEPAEAPAKSGSLQPAAAANGKATPRADSPAAPATPVPALPPAPSSDLPAVGGGSENSALPTTTAPNSTPATPSAAAPSSPPAPTAAAKPQTLYQRVDIARTMRMTIEGLPIEQLLQYHLLSQLTVEPPQPDGTRRVTQQITAAELDRADETSQVTYAGALKNLTGAKLTYGINAAGNLVEFTGPGSGPAASPFSGLGGSGVLVTSLLDDDGWKELIHLAFFQPDPQRKPDKPWQRQMKHDWGPLGVWTGVTTFVPRPRPSPDVDQFDYSHDMTYTPPREAAGGLPFQITDARFTPREARGVVYYDTRQNRVTRVDERFHVQGTLVTSLLGQPSSLALEELQILMLTMSDQPLRSTDAGGR